LPRIGSYFFRASCGGIDEKLFEFAVGVDVRRPGGKREVLE